MKGARVFRGAFKFFEVQFFRESLLRKLAVRVDFSDAKSLQSFLIIFAIQNVPLFTAFQDLFFLGRNLRADFGVNLFFHLQQRRKNIHDFLADGIAILDEVHVGKRDKKIDDSV